MVSCDSLLQWPGIQLQRPLSCMLDKRRHSLETVFSFTRESDYMNFIFQFSIFWLECRCVGVWLRAVVGHPPEHSQRINPGMFSPLNLVKIEALLFRFESLDRVPWYKCSLLHPIRRQINQ